MTDNEFALITAAAYITGYLGGAARMGEGLTPEEVRMLFAKLDAAKLITARKGKPE